MSLKLKYTDEHGILHINMSPTTDPSTQQKPQSDPTTDPKNDLSYPKFDTINNRFQQYDIFGGKYDLKRPESGGSEARSLFTSRYNSVEEELANTPYAFATDRRLDKLDVTIESRIDTPSKDIEDDRFFKSINVKYDDGLFGPQIDFASKSIKTDSDSDTPAFTVTQLIHAQDRYFDLSGKSAVLSANDRKDSASDSVRTLTNRLEVHSVPSSGKSRGKSVNDEAFKVLSNPTVIKAVQEIEVSTPALPVVPTAKRKRESSFAIIAETPNNSRPTSPRSLPIDIRTGRISPFRGKGFREETSRHSTPKTSRNNSRANSPPRRRTNSLSKLESKMAQTATLPLSLHTLSRPHSPRNYIKENIEEVRELSELNREQHEAEAEQKRIEEEEALLKEMGLLDPTDQIRSLNGSKTTSRSNSPSKIHLRSRSNSPSAILLYENISTDSTDFINSDDGTPKPVMHKSRIRTVSRSQPQSNNGSPIHSKIPKRQNSVSPVRTDNKRDLSKAKKTTPNNLNNNQRFISNSTSSINDAIKIGGTVSDKKKIISKSTQHLSISPIIIKGKPPISPGRGGPPPSNRAINAKRLSPIVGTPNKSPVEGSKPGSARTPTKGLSPVVKKSVKTAGNTPATSRLNSRLQSRTVSRSQSPDKKRDVQTKSTAGSRVSTNRTVPNKAPVRTPSTRTTNKPPVANKPEIKKTINRTNSIKSLVRTSSTKTLIEKPPTLKKKDSTRDLKENSQTVGKTNETNNKSKIKKETDDNKSQNKDEKIEIGSETKKSTDSATERPEETTTQDNETQYDKITNEKGELVILTKKSVVSMTTAAITAQPLEVVTTVTNQLPAALEKARDKAILERLSSKDSLAPKEEYKDDKKTDHNEKNQKTEDETKANKTDQSEAKTKNQPTQNKTATVADDSIKLKPLQPPFNNPQVEKAKQKIDDILKAPEVSTESILKAAEAETKTIKNSFRNIADKTKNEVKEKRNEKLNKLIDIKDKAMKQTEKTSDEIRSEANKIVDSIMTPVGEPPKEIDEQKVKDELKNTIEPIVMVVNEKKNDPKPFEMAIKMNEALVKGEPEVEVQSSNVSTPDINKMAVHNKMADGNSSDQSAHSNGGYPGQSTLQRFPQSTSTTPKPPARTHKSAANQNASKEESIKKDDKEENAKKKNLSRRLAGKCAQKSKCCACCVKPEVDDDEFSKVITKDVDKGDDSKMSRLNCCKNTEKTVKNTVEFENETKRKRSFRDVICCTKRHRIGDSAADVMRAADVTASPANQGCCGRRAPPPERRDSIISDQQQKICCNNRFCNWLCRRAPPPQSRRNSVFSKNKSLSPTLPPEDTRNKLDPSLVEHSSMIRGAIPVLPIVLAYFCLFCNVIVPGLGSILSGVFCLCFGIPRFGVHDGLKHRFGSFLINLLVGCGQLFTVLFCLVGWGWSIWWGVIMVRVSRKYRKLAAEAHAEEMEQAPPVIANNHNSRA